MKVDIKNDEPLNKILDVLSNQGIETYDHKYNYCYDNNGGVSIMLHVYFKTHDLVREVNKDLDNSLQSLVGNGTIEQISTIFMMGSAKNKINDKFVNSYELRISLTNIEISKEVKDKAMAEYVEKCFYSLRRTGVSNFVNKYNINTVPEFIEIITEATKYVNKSAKLDPIDFRTKKKYYMIKDWVIKVLLKQGYISKISRHEINGREYALFTTKVESETSYGGFISFHVPLDRWFKFQALVKHELEYYPPEENDYTPSGHIENRELMSDFISVVNSNFVGQKFFDNLKIYLENK